MSVKIVKLVIFVVESAYQPLIIPCNVWSGVIVDEIPDNLLILPVCANKLNIPTTLGTSP